MFDIYPEWQPVMAVVVAGCLICQLVAVVAAHRKGEDAATITNLWIAILATLYPLGVSLKFSGIGPDFVRWHLADLGFPACLVITGTYILRLCARHGVDLSTHVKVIEEKCRLTSRRLTMVSIALTVCIIYEIWAELFKPSRVVGGFDWVDIAAYVLCSLIMAALLSWQLKHEKQSLRHAIRQSA